MSCEFCENLKWDKYCAYTREDEKGAKVSTILLDYGYTFSPEKQIKFCPCCGAKNPNAPKKYYVTMKVQGEYTVEVEAQSWEEAKEKATDCWVNEDFGNLEEIDMDFSSYSTEDSLEDVYL